MAVHVYNATGVSVSPVALNCALCVRQWCVEENNTISCMAYDQDPWGSTRQFGCDIFSKADLCDTVNTVKVLGVIAVCMLFVADVFSEKMQITAIIAAIGFGISVGIMAMLGTLRDNLNDEYTPAQSIEYTIGFWYILGGMLLSFVTMLLCFLDHTDCCGAKDDIPCLRSQGEDYFGRCSCCYGQNHDVSTYNVYNHAYTGR
eukprot:m.684271 g.684271  ORF g.684271 m.684271 type:complete len:202 (+) comp22833_c2_seq11:1420-2025(+)